MKLITLAAILPLLATPALAHAITLAPGQTATPNLLALSPNDADANLDANGVPLASAVPFAYPNVPGAGGYSFGVTKNTLTGATSYLPGLSFGAPLPIRTVSLTGYQGFSVDAGFTNGTTFAPVSVSRSADGNIITFSFTGLPTPPDPTQPQFFGQADLLIQTNATNFTNSPATITFVDQTLPDGTLSFTQDAPSPAFSATAPVPEISSLSALLLATTSLALRFRRRL